MADSWPIHGGLRPGHHSDACIHSQGLYMSRTSIPVIGITANLRQSEQHPQVNLQAVNEKYGNAVREVAGAMPLFIPPLGDAMCIETLLRTLDGVLLTGGASNIEPHHYGQTPAPGDDQRDPGRDGLVLPLIRRAIEVGLPVLGICRGIQEINVALGGTLHQRLHEVPGRQDHRRSRDKPFLESLAPRHRLTVTSGGFLAALVGEGDVEVNSLHGQGLDRIADRLSVEAVAEDGTVEAVIVNDAPGFAFGVQWHAEHDVHSYPLYRAIFAAFGDAVSNYAMARSAATYPVLA